MENIWAIIISATISGLLATVITILVNKYNETKAEKKKVLSVLLAYRYDIVNVENVNTMNRIQMIFYKNVKVIKAWNEFNDSTYDQGKENQIVDKYLKLLEEIAAASGYSKMKWDNIKKYYFPKGLSDKMIQENAIRAEVLKKINTVGNSVDGNTQAGLIVITKLLEQPDGLEKLTKLYEITNKGKN
ncbi:MAG: hypothetical protein IJR67_01750 [Acholeplasmatales bacterium]|nr:hypothetical protein [Acholeplasmatales bacterium]